MATLIVPSSATLIFDPIFTPPNTVVVAGSNVYAEPPVLLITPLLILIVVPSTLTPPNMLVLAVGSVYIDPLPPPNTEFPRLLRISPPAGKRNLPSVPNCHVVPSLVSSAIPAASKVIVLLSFHSKTKLVPVLPWPAGLVAI